MIHAPWCSLQYYLLTRTWKQQKCLPTEEWIKKMWYIYTREHYFSHKKKKKRNCVLCRDVKGPRDCHTEWSESEDKQVLYINAYMWNLEIWYRWSYLKIRNRDICREQMYGYQRGTRGGVWEELRDWDWQIYTAAAAKSLQSCLTLCDAIDGRPPGSAAPGILQARILDWVAISFSNAGKWKVKVKSLSHVWLFATPWTAACQASLSITNAHSSLKLMSI